MRYKALSLISSTVEEEEELEVANRKIPQDDSKRSLGNRQNLAS